MTDGWGCWQECEGTEPGGMLEEWEAGDGLTTRLGAMHCRVLANARERRRVAHPAALHQTSQILPQPAAALYPIDTIKTRLQAMRSGGGISALLKVQRGDGCTCRPAALLWHMLLASHGSLDTNSTCLAAPAPAAGALIRPGLPACSSAAHSRAAGAACTPASGATWWVWRPHPPSSWRCTSRPSR